MSKPQLVTIIMLTMLSANCGDPRNTYLTSTGEEGGDTVNVTIGFLTSDEDLDGSEGCYRDGVLVEAAEAESLEDCVEVNVTSTSGQSSSALRRRLDCNDRDRAVYPGAPEVCDHKDNNCNGQTDEGIICECTADIECVGNSAGRFCNLGTNTCEQCLTDTHCGDQNSCNGVEQCVDFICMPSAEVCDEAHCANGACVECTISQQCADEQRCNPETNVCDALLCDDGDVCTVETVVDHECVHVEQVNCCSSDFECGFADVCTSNVTSVAGQCVQCTEDNLSRCTDTQNCEANVCTELNCNDGDACTADTAIANSCTITPIINCCNNDAQCNVGVCSSHELAVAGICRGCANSQQCTTEQFCDVATNECVTLSCDDHDACTTDYAFNHECVADQFVGCCNSNEECSGELVCTVQTPTEVGSCVQCTSNAGCDDAYSCVDNTCAPVVCVDEGDLCTREVVQNNECLHQPIPSCCYGEYDETTCTDLRPATLMSSYLWGCSWAEVVGENYFTCTSCSDVDDDGYCGWEICNNDLDDDGNGQIDENVCLSEICGNSRDDDNDGLVDENDTTEEGSIDLKCYAVEFCGNSADDNGDGQVDERPCTELCPSSGVSIRNAVGFPLSFYLGGLTPTNQSTGVLCENIEPNGSCRAEDMCSALYFYKSPQPQWDELDATQRLQYCQKTRCARGTQELVPVLGTDPNGHEACTCPAF